MNKGKSKGEPESQLDSRSKAGDLFSAKTISQYVTGGKGKDEDQHTSEEEEDDDNNDSVEDDEDDHVDDEDSDTNEGDKK